MLGMNWPGKLITTQESLHDREGSVMLTAVLISWVSVNMSFLATTSCRTPPKENFFQGSLTSAPVFIRNGSKSWWSAVMNPQCSTIKVSMWMLWTFLRWTSWLVLIVKRTSWKRGLGFHLKYVICLWSFLRDELREFDLRDKGLFSCETSFFFMKLTTVFEKKMRSKQAEREVQFRAKPSTKIAPSYLIHSNASAWPLSSPRPK